MSYLIDVARGLSRAMRNPVDFALYVSFFPQVIARSDTVVFEVVERRFCRMLLQTIASERFMDERSLTIEHNRESPR